MQRTQSAHAGAYLTGPAMPNPAAMFSYTVAPTALHPASKPVAYATSHSTTTMPELNDELVREAIERLTKAPGNDPQALQQAALDMELVIRHFDSLSEAFGPEAALTSFALDLAERSKHSRKPSGKTRVVRRLRSVKQFSDN